jgi:hypothetical protein
MFLFYFPNIEVKEKIVIIFNIEDLKERKTHITIDDTADFWE